MLGWLMGRSLRRTGQQLYERIVAQAREPSLYETCGVPDTMDGRLEMVLLHTVLVLDRLQAEGPSAQRLGQHLMERLVAGVDDALRRIGLGDDSVAPRIKKLASALAERARDYRAALPTSADERAGIAAAPTGCTTGEALEAAFLEHVLARDRASPTPEEQAAAKRLAAYTVRVRASLAATPAQALLSGALIFPTVIESETGTLEPRA
jgi:cytochrome b pre-mRNA-processing protein 3